MFVGCIAYADDIILLSASVVHLNKMLDIFHPGYMLDVKFNQSKSCLFTVGKDCKDQLASLHLGDGNVSWADSMKYLGIHFLSNERLKVDICPFLRKFYASVNANYSLKVC